MEYISYEPPIPEYRYYQEEYTDDSAFIWDKKNKKPTDQDLTCEITHNIPLDSNQQPIAQAGIEYEIDLNCGSIPLVDATNFQVASSWGEFTDIELENGRGDTIGTCQFELGLRSAICTKDYGQLNTEDHVIATFRAGGTTGESEQVINYSRQGQDGTNTVDGELHYIVVRQEGEVKQYLPYVQGETEQ